MGVSVCVCEDGVTMFTMNLALLDPYVIIFLFCCVSAVLVVFQFQYFSTKQQVGGKKHKLLLLLSFSILLFMTITSVAVMVDCFVVVFATASHC